MSASADHDTVDERSIAAVNDLAAGLFGPTSPAVRVEFGALSHPGVGPGR
jgi:hypothetical protein